MVRPWIAEREKLWNPVKWKNQFPQNIQSPTICNFWVYFAMFEIELNTWSNQWLEVPFGLKTCAVMLLFVCFTTRDWPFLVVYIRQIGDLSQSNLEFAGLEGDFVSRNLDMLTTPSVTSSFDKYV